MLVSGAIEPEEKKRKKKEYAYKRYKRGIKKKMSNKADLTVIKHRTKPK